jgi:hypothetical protein
MGFLDNTTNNIIIDAVLTDYGRELLSRNDGSFQVVQFAVGDDEVNYDVIKKYGVPVGKEKIEKNTPVFEAFTNQNLALKNKMISLSDPSLRYYPSLSLSTTTTSTSLTNKQTGVTTEIILNTAAATTRTTALISFEQVLTDAAVSQMPKVPAELQDNAFIIKMNDSFLRIVNKSQLSSLTAGGNVTNTAPESIDVRNNAIYRVYRNGDLNQYGGSVCSFYIASKNISSNTFDLQADTTMIKTYIQVMGVNSGVSLTIPVRINKC